MVRLYEMLDGPIVIFGIHRSKQQSLALRMRRDEWLGRSCSALAHETLAEKLGNLHNGFHTNLDAAEQYLCAALARLPSPKPPKASSAHRPHDSGYEALQRDIMSQQRSSSESSRPSAEFPSTRDSKSSQTTLTNAVAENVEDESATVGAKGRYNRILQSLRPELERQIQYIKNLRQDSTEVSWKSDDRVDGDLKVQENLAEMPLKQHVLEGRRRNWKRTRFSLPATEEEEWNHSRSVSPASGGKQMMEDSTSNSQASGKDVDLGVLRSPRLR
ncbi:MAG: hypothetical protein Q9159_000055 [Coniocarpon cinnabarinum]